MSPERTRPKITSLDLPWDQDNGQLTWIEKQLGSTMDLNFITYLLMKQNLEMLSHLKIKIFMLRTHTKIQRFNQMKNEARQTHGW